MNLVLKRPDFRRSRIDVGALALEGGFFYSTVTLTGVVTFVDPKVPVTVMV